MMSRPNPMNNGSLRPLVTGEQKYTLTQINRSDQSQIADVGKVFDFNILTVGQIMPDIHCAPCQQKPLFCG